ncbi:MAG: protein kinase [Nocardioides sp.]
MATFPTIGDTFGPYAIEGVLGRGGMGYVFAGTQLALRRRVAIKVLMPHLSEEEEYRSRFFREVSSLAALNHPHIPQILDHGEIDGCLFFASQLIPGGDLAAHLKTNGPIRVREALRLTEQVAEALDVAHTAGLLHRDIKPANVLLHHGRRESFAYLSDFGVAVGGRSELTQTGAVVGSWGYLSPERCRGEKATVASDLYSLGCLLHFALKGAAPYTGTDTEVLLGHISAPIPAWSPDSEDVSPGVLASVNELLARLMAKQPSSRPSSAAEVADALAQILEQPRSEPAPAASLPLASPGDETLLQLPRQAAAAIGSRSAAEPAQDLRGAETSYGKAPSEATLLRSSAAAEDAALGENTSKPDSSADLSEPATPLPGVTSVTSTTNDREEPVARGEVPDEGTLPRTPAATAAPPPISKDAPGDTASVETPPSATSLWRRIEFRIAVGAMVFVLLSTLTLNYSSTDQGPSGQEISQEMIVGLFQSRGVSKQSSTLALKALQSKGYQVGRYASQSFESKLAQTTVYYSPNAREEATILARDLEIDSIAPSSSLRIVDIAIVLGSDESFLQ